MKPTSLSFTKIRWLLSHELFRKSPLRVLRGVLSWEIIRILGRPRILKFDKNLRLYVEPNDGIGRQITYLGYHEPEYFEFLDSFLKPGMTFIDIGANIGAYTVYVAKRVGPNGHVFAFEPDPENFQKLKVNAALNQFTNVSLFNNALFNQDGPIYIRWHPDSARRAVTHSKADSWSSAQAIRLDSLLDRLPEVIDYMKVDTPGHNLSVLEGAMEVLCTRPPKIIQLESINNKNEVAALLRGNEYELFKLVSKDGIFSFIKCENIPYRMLAIHKSFSSFRSLLSEQFTFSIAELCQIFPNCRSK